LQRKGAWAFGAGWLGCHSAPGPLNRMEPWRRGLEMFVGTRARARGPARCSAAPRRCTCWIRWPAPPRARRCCSGARAPAQTWLNYTHHARANAHPSFFLARACTTQQATTASLPIGRLTPPNPTTTPPPGVRGRGGAALGHRHRRAAADLRVRGREAARKLGGGGSRGEAAWVWGCEGSGLTAVVPEGG
jgi:hypothetical protein